MKHLITNPEDIENNVAQMEPDDFILPDDEEPYDRHAQQRLDDAALKEAKRLREELEKIAKTMDELMKIHLCQKQAE